MQEVLERKSIKSLDFNCDLAQAYGVYKNDKEFELLDYGFDQIVINYTNDEVVKGKLTLKEGCIITAKMY